MPQPLFNFQGSAAFADLAFLGVALVEGLVWSSTCSVNPGGLSCASVVAPESARRARARVTRRWMFVRYSTRRSALLRRLDAAVREQAAARQHPRAEIPSVTTRSEYRPSQYPSFR